jgi:putative protease
MQEHAPISEHEVGVVTHYWNHLGVAGVHLTAPIDVGDHVHVLGHTTDFEQDVDSMQIDHEEVQHAGAGEDVGIRVADHAREHDRIFKLVSDDVGGGEHAL